MLRVSFSSESTARSAVNVLAAYGYSAKQSGRDLVTDCPPLLAIPAIHKQVGFAKIDRLDLNRQTGPDPATLGVRSTMRGTEPARDLSA